jgi:hypothetical protein
MKRLRDYAWWPRIWADYAAADEVSRHGCFITCRSSNYGLTITIDCNKTSCNSTIKPQPGLDLEKLGQFLRRHRNKPMSIVENLEIEL